MFNTLQEARQVISDDDSSFSDHAHAAYIICADKNSTFDDILLCLGRGGVAASFAVIELYTRTGRSRENPGQSLAADPSVVTDVAEWRKYIAELQ